MMGAVGSYTLSIVTMSGAITATHGNLRTNDPVDVSSLVPGAYLIPLRDELERPLGVQKFIKP